MQRPPRLLSEARGSLRVSQGTIKSVDVDFDLVGDGDVGIVAAEAELVAEQEQQDQDDDDQQDHGKHAATTAASNS